MICAKCGNANMEPAHLCQVCGAPLPDDPQREPAATTAASVTGSDQPLSGMLYRALLGQIHTDYYLRHFGRFDAIGKATLTWHWPAFFFTLGWLVFRRMGLYALGFAAFSVTAGLLLLGVVPLVWGTSEVVKWGSAAVFFLLVWVLPALLANALYHRHCNRYINHALVLASNMNEACMHLTLRSSTPRHAWWIGIVVALAWLCAAAWGVWLAQATYWPSRMRGASTAVERPAAAPAVTPGSAAPAASVAVPAVIPMSTASSPTIAAPVAPAPTASPAASANSAPAVVAPEPKPAVAVGTEAVVSVPARVEPPLRKPRDAGGPAPRPGGDFVVAVGVFAQESNADRVYNQLAAAGLPVHANAMQTPEGQRLTIRVGPFRSRDEARQAAQQIRALELPAVVMRRDGATGR